RPRGAQIRHARSEAEEQLCGSRSKPAEQVEDQKLDVPEAVFHVVAENPQVKHVATQMKPAGMHEHGTEESRNVRERIGHEAPRHEGPLHDEGLAAVQLDEEEQ